jgi:ribonuclease PH
LPTLPACPQETLDNLRRAMENTKIMCAVMLDTKVRRLRQQQRGVAAVGRGSNCQGVSRQAKQHKALWRLYQLL